MGREGHAGTALPRAWGGGVTQWRKGAKGGRDPCDGARGAVEQGRAGAATFTAPRLPPATAGRAPRRKPLLKAWAAWRFLAGIMKRDIGWLAFLGLACAATALVADGPADNVADKVRPVPPAGIAYPPEVREFLRMGATMLGRDIDQLRKDVAEKPELAARLPDVEVFQKAVDWAVRHDEVFKTNELATARLLLQTGHERAALQYYLKSSLIADYAI